MSGATLSPEGGKSATTRGAAHDTAGDIQKMVEKAKKRMKGSGFFMVLSRFYFLLLGGGAICAVSGGDELDENRTPMSGFQRSCPGASPFGAGGGFDSGVGAPAPGGADGGAPTLCGGGVTQGS
jgi:hypothetical protein